MIFPNLGLIDDIVARCPDKVPPKFAKTIFVCVQHLLETSGSLFEAIIKLGANPRNIYVLGKHYSSNVSVTDKLKDLGVNVFLGAGNTILGEYRATFTADIRRMWQAVVGSDMIGAAQHVLVLDDGGLCASAAPRSFGRASVVGVEQTTSGLREAQSIQFPVIEVAGSAAKRWLEPPMIAETIAAKVVRRIREGTVPQRCGVIGYGAIGRAVAQILLQSDRDVFVWDTNPALAWERTSLKLPGVTWCHAASEVLTKADCVFGCAGEDVLPDGTEHFNDLEGSKTLISCSSADVEFRGMLRAASSSASAPLDCLDNIVFRPHQKVTVEILRGGFPINFDGGPESVPASEIQMTRGLLLGGLIQAMACEHGKNRHWANEMLNPWIQRFVVEQWMLRAGKWDGDLPNRMLEVINFQDLGWVERESSGTLGACSAVEKAFGGSQELQSMK